MQNRRARRRELTKLNFVFRSGQGSHNRSARKIKERPGEVNKCMSTQQAQTQIKPQGRSREAAQERETDDDWGTDGMGWR